MRRTLIVNLSRDPECNLAFSSSIVPTTLDIDFQFSDEFIRKHYGKLVRWESELSKAQEQRRRVFNKSLSITNRLLAKLNKVFSYSGQNVVPIGSSINGLKKQSSDLDIVLITDQNDDKQAEFNHKFLNIERFRREQMNRVAGILNGSKLVEVGSIQQLIFSNVPIVKFRSREGICVDLQFNNVSSIQSSLFIRMCVEWNIIVPIVIHWMNAFFESIRLKDSRHGLFSSYHLNILALHFLQSAPLYILPDMIGSCPQLHPSYSWRKVAKLLTREACTVELVHVDNIHEISAAESIVKLIDYYSQLDLQNIAIDVRGRTYRKLAEREDDRFIHLVDPYFEDSGHPRCNVRNGASLVEEAFSALKSELEMDAFRKLTQMRCS